MKKNGAKLKQMLLFKRMESTIGINWQNTLLKLRQIQTGTISHNTNGSALLITHQMKVFWSWKHIIVSPMVLVSLHSYNALLMNTITKTSHRWSHWDALNNSSFTYSVHSWFFKQSSQPCSNLKTTTPSAMANHCQEKRLAELTWIFQLKTSKNTARTTSAQLTIIVQHCL